MKIFFSLMVVGGMAFASPVNAVSKNAPDKMLRSIEDQLKTADGFTYTLTVQTELQGKSQQGTTVQSLTYTSKADFIQYTATSDAIFFMNKNGMFRVNKSNKAAHYRQFTSDSMRQRVQAIMLQTDAAKMMDSFFFRKATVISRKESKTALVYRLGYPATSMIRDLELSYDTKKAFLSSVTYSLERPVDKSGRKESFIHQKVSMTGYDHHMPDEVQKIIQVSGDLKTYLQQTYAGYAINTL